MTNSHSFDLLPSSRSHSTTTAIKRRVPTMAMVSSLCLDCFARNPYYLQFFISGGKMYGETNCV